MAADYRGLSLSRRQFVQGAGMAGLGLLVSIDVLAATGCGAPSRSADQPQRLRRVGYLAAFPLDYPAPLGAPHLDSFRQGLRELGYVEGQNLEVEYRSAELRFDELPRLASELVGLPVDVLVVADTRSIQPAKQATSTIPMVLVVTTDPVASGHVASLARPGGHITGLTMAPVETMGKRLELLRDIAPGLSHVGVLYSADDRLAQLAAAEVARSAAVLGLVYEELPVQQRDDIGPALDRAHRAGVDGLLVYGGPLMNAEARRVANLALAAHIPTVGMSREVVAAGLLVAYAPSLPALYYRAASYVDRILRGANPAELPVERPTRYDLVFNARTASTLGITLPRDLLLDATEVIQ